MRAEIVAGAVIPDYEPTDHTGKHRKLSDLQGPDPMILVLSRGGYCPKDRRQAEGLIQLHHEMEVGYSRLVTISTTAPASALIGSFYPIRDERFRRISTSPGTRTPSTIR